MRFNLCPHSDVCHFCPPAGGSGEAAAGPEDRHLQPGVHLGAHGGGGLLLDDLERKPLWS